MYRRLSGAGGTVFKPDSAAEWFLLLGHHDQCRAQHAIGDGVALLQDSHHCVRLLVRVNHANRLMKVRIELLTDGVDFFQTGFFKRGDDLLERDLSTGLEPYRAG